MIVDPGTLTMAARNGSAARNLYVPPGGQPVNPDRVVELLASHSSPRAQPGARVLLREMARGPWVITASVHRVGHAGDATPHVNVIVGRKQYHLRLDASGCVFDITSVTGEGTQRPSGNLPWVPPGA